MDELAKRTCSDSCSDVELPGVTDSSAPLEIAADTTSRARYGTRVAVDVDPGYQGTAVMFGQSAPSLAPYDLPSQVGVLTPAVAFEDALESRLRDNGFKLETTRL